MTAGKTFFRDMSILGLITLSLFVLKSFWALSQASEPFVLDEHVYKFNARSLFDLTKYDSARYPPMYPLALAPAFLFDHWFEVMLILNAFWSSLIVPASWFLARTAGLCRPLLAAGLCALIPMHVIYPNILFSENVFLPLFTLCAALTLRGGEVRAKEAFGFGIVLGLTHLTKYIFLPEVPLFAGLWIWQRARSKNEEGAFFLKRWMPEIFLCLGYGVLLLIWVIYGRFSGFSTGELFGLGISGIKTNAGTFESLWMWVVAYFLYLLLIWFPLWGIFWLWVSGYSTSEAVQRVNPAERNFYILLFLLTVLFFLICVEHSFGQPYNYPEPNRIMGRYFMPLFPFMLIAGLRILEKFDETGRRVFAGRAAFGISILTAAALFGRWVLFENGVWSFKTGFANRIPGTVDSLVYAHFYFFLSAVLVVVFILLFLFFRKTRIFFTVFPLLVFMGISLFKDALIFKDYPRRLPYRDLFSALCRNETRQGPIYVYNFREENFSLPRWDSSLRFWEVEIQSIFKESVSPRELIAKIPFSGPAFLLTSSHLNLPLYRELNQENRTIFLYRIDGLDSGYLAQNLGTSGKDFS